MNVTLNTLEPHSFNTAVGDKQKGARYQVLIDGVIVGEVNKVSNESWRKSGRIRTTMIGFDRSWSAELSGDKEVGHKHSARQEAINALVKAHAQLNPEVK